MYGTQNIDVNTIEYNLLVLVTVTELLSPFWKIIITPGLVSTIHGFFSPPFLSLFGSKCCPSFLLHLSAFFVLLNPEVLGQSIVVGSTTIIEWLQVAWEDLSNKHCIMQGIEINHENTVIRVMDKLLCSSCYLSLLCLRLCLCRFAICCMAIMLNRTDELNRLANPKLEWLMAGRRKL